MAKSCICAQCGSHHEPGNTRKPTSKLGKGKDNPFATRGRDEFSGLVAKMEERKQRILSRSETENGLIVRFVNSNGNKLKPVIIRAKIDIGQMNNTKGVKISSEEFTAEKTVQSKEKSNLRKLNLKQSYNMCYFGAIIVVIIALFFMICYKIMWNNNPGN